MDSWVMSNKIVLIVYGTGHFSNISLHILQEPNRGYAYADTFDRTPIDPPPVVEVCLDLNRQPIDMSRLPQNLHALVLTATLWDENGRELRQYRQLQGPSGRPPAQPSPMLEGSYTQNLQRINMPDGREADLALFGDLSVRQEGTYPDAFFSFNFPTGLRFALSALQSTSEAHPMSAHSALYIGCAFSKPFDILPAASCAGGGCDDVVDGVASPSSGPSSAPGCEPETPVPTELSRHLQSQGMLLFNYPQLQQVLDSLRRLRNK
ncbi:hypothetical protein HK097_007330 [Rhizophlyctis rosea]|uniref:Velvet domain-containing protein n=1 Tax=Rhizophlyctis rosea TaxID=64517 RepID=A0AAD5SJY9_9FUNG|nr:hypothetical protein HK097_007330 [Rhizophlyctis rosea]